MAARFEVLGVVVEDMARSLAFYRRLGFDIPADADEQGHVEVTLPGGVRVAWDTVEVVKSFDPNWEPPEGSQRVGLAFRCDDAADVDAVYGQMLGAGYRSRRDPWDAFGGQRYAVIEDPDGNSVDLFADQ